ncbi:MAG TPA: 2-amino-4-oxopentanoate thiolase subunit OrtB [Anaerovoracaceae bacterium]|nr:2-amino-4-oxopentanoate thiolase subunit OrtB [Anaerovoracaceae bacterium]
MALAKDYASVIGRKGEVMKAALGMNYEEFESGSIAFDYEKMMRSTGFTLEEIERVQSLTGVGNTPLFELRNITALARKCAKPGYGATICAKDECANPSGSFKARRAACAVAFAKKNGYKGVIAATSGNYGAAVASQAAMQGLKCIIVQEAFDSKEIGQPEIIEKARACEAMGAEVVQITVGPELFYEAISLLEDTQYFNASLYSPFGIAGIETLGYEIAMQCRERFGKDPDVVVCTNAGGGMATGTARGLKKAGSKDTKVYGASINLTGLHMASDEQFNKKSCTTGHTGFGVPFATWPDRSDVPRSAARPLRYLDRYVTVTQGEVMCITELLATLEGIERGPAGNTALAAAFCIAQEMPEDQILVISETEYTGAGKHVQPQLDFARDNGIEVRFGNPNEDKPGVNVILPESAKDFRVHDLDLDRMKNSLIKKALTTYTLDPTEEDIKFLAVETALTVDEVKVRIDNIKKAL